MSHRAWSRVLRSGVSSLLFLLLPCVPASAAPARAAAERPPNLVIILADDLGYGDLSCYGHAKFKTPNIDRLASEGARLTGFYVPVPYCAPSRAALLTGRYPPRCGLTNNPFPKGDAEVKNADHVGLPLKEKTLADVLRAAGYRTACFGKWHLGHQPHFRPTRRGFDEYFGVLYSNDMHPVELFDGEEMVEYPLVQATLTKRLTERATSFLEKNKDRPFLLYLPHHMPHKPLAASEAFAGKSGAGLYGDVMAELDRGVGQVLDKLKALGLENNTLVVFTSDNGPWYGGSTGGLRGMKGRYWEGGIRVPMIARLPGKIPPGSTVHEPAIIMDVFATACAAAGVAPKEESIDGKDLMPLLTGAEKKGPHEAVVSTRDGQVVTVRSGRWKLHLMAHGPAKEKVWRPDEKWTDPRAPDGTRILAPAGQAHPSEFPGLREGPAPAAGLLFDLEQDPGEQKDLSADHPDVVEQLRRHAKQLREGMVAPGLR